LCSVAFDSARWTTLGCRVNSADPTSVSLAVYVPEIGGTSETFIRRHIQDILPGQTAVFARRQVADLCSHGPTAAPVLLLEHARRSSVTRYLSAIERRIRGTGSAIAHERRSVLRFLRDYRVQVVLGEYLDQSVPWLDVAHKAGARFFAHAHGYDVSSRLRDARWRRRYLRLAEAEGIITVSQVSRGRLVDLGLPPARIHVIPCGVDVPDRLERTASHSRLNCLAVGRMTSKKAPLLTLDAFRQALAVVPGLRLDFVGTGKLMPFVERFVAESGLGESVTLHGSLPNVEVQTLMNRADIFLQHSVVDPETGDEEGLPVAILEAMAHGLPVVSTLHAGIPEAVVDGVTGLLVSEGDAEGMAERIVALARDPGGARQMGASGWARAKEKYSWERERSDLLRLFELPESETRA
jgi:colanic acid/amylovoran biosynthesis glycosyltransferase